MRELGRIVMGLVLLVLLGALGGSAHSGPAPSAPSGASATEGKVLDLRIIQSGHSLTDPIPPLLRDLAIAAGAQADIKIERSTSPGSTMDHRWRNGPDPGMPDARRDIGGYDLLVLTERVPLQDAMRRHNSIGRALAWLRHAHRYGDEGQGARTMLYASWVDISSGPGYANPYNDPEGDIPWRQRLELEFARWSEIAETINRLRPADAPPMDIIPATLVMAAAYDAIEEGDAAGIADLGQLFSDEIHLSGAGTYLIALTQFASIYDRDPRGLPIPSRVGAEVTPAMAQWMQGLVWSVVQTYKAGLARYRSDYASFTARDLQACLWADLTGARKLCLEDLQ